MKVSAQVPQSAAAEAADQQVCLDAESPLFAAMHSDSNIEIWLDYLPSDCIETMIRMGWNYTT